MKSEEMKTTTILLSDQHLATIKIWAIRNRTSMSGLVRKLLEKREEIDVLIEAN